MFAATKSKKKKKKKVLSKELFSALEKYTCFGEMMVEYGKNHYRTKGFDPFLVLCMMDLEGGKLNYEAIGLLRTLETNGKKYTRNTLIPSVGELKKAAEVPFTRLSRP